MEAIQNHFGGYGWPLCCFVERMLQKKSGLGQ